MEKHFLSQYVAGEQSFLSQPWYNSHGDCIMYKTSDEAVIGDRIDEILTIYRSIQARAPIGFKIKGVRAILNKFGYDGLAVNTSQEGQKVKSISIVALLLAAYEEGPLNIKRRQAYAGVLGSPQRESLDIPLEVLQAN